MTAHPRHFPGRPTLAAVTPRNPPSREPRIVDEGRWEPVSNRWFLYGAFMFICGALAMWALLDAIT